MAGQQLVATESVSDEATVSPLRQNVQETAAAEYHSQVSAGNY
jgi:hypothetical protein